MHNQRLQPYEMPRRRFAFGRCEALDGAVEAGSYKLPGGGIEMHEVPQTDPVTFDPDKFRVRLENKRIRVLEARIASGEGHGMHWHPEHLVYTLSSYKVQDTFPDGSTKSMEREAGELLWGEELAHATQNVGTTTVRALIIEFKDR